MDNKEQIKGNGPKTLDVDGTNPLFFYGSKNEFSEFSQFTPCSFTVSKARIAELVGHVLDEGAPDDELAFNSAEQFMMFCKAARFLDRERQALILSASTPIEQKRIGRRVAGFTDRSWDAVKVDVVVEGNVAKFGQNKELGDLLLSTGNRLLVEAAPRDRVWGIGYGKQNAMANKEKWGQNLLGVALMRARSRLCQSRP